MSNEEEIKEVQIKEEIKKDRKKNTPEYNKAYYQAHKDHIINDLISKVVECPLCLHKVTKSHLSRHKKSKLCERRTKKNE